MTLSEKLVAVRAHLVVVNQDTPSPRVDRSIELIDEVLAVISPPTRPLPCCGTCPSMVRDEFKRYKGACAGEGSPCKGLAVKANSKGCYKHPAYVERGTVQE